MRLKKSIIFSIMLLFSGIIFSQTITGTVSDESGPLPGASILVKGTTNGTQTDLDGKYTLENVSAEATMIVSFVGYKTQEIAVNGKTTINVLLVSDSDKLEEVVVTGYTTQTRGDITGSVASVDMQEAMKVPVANAAETLQGRVSGVNIVSSGAPGTAPKVSIRGFGTINSTDPLYIIDGVQTDDSSILNNINPADIDQMNVLKDGAAAIYGARASNGVVIITTKSGGYNMEKARVSLDVYTGFSKITNAPEVLNASQHAEVLLQSRLNDGLSGSALSHGQYDPNGTGTYTVPNTIQGYRRVISYNPTTFSENGDFTASVNPNGTNWIEAVSRTAPTQNVSFSVENGGKSGKYFLSANYLNRDGILNHTGFKRISTRLNSEFKIGEKLKVGEHINVSYSNTFSGAEEAIENTFRMTPLLPVRDDNGLFAGVAGSDLGNTRNPAAQLYRARNNFNKRYSLTGDIYMSYDILDELTIKTVLGGGFGTRDSQIFTALDPEHGEPLSTNNLEEIDNTSYNWIWTNTVNYNKKFGDHRLNVILGIEALKNGAKERSFQNTGYLLEKPNFYTIANGEGKPNVRYSNESWNSLWSIFASANYNFQNKYYLTGTLRRDTSSRFKGDNQSDIFPSFSLGWIVSKENFWNSDSFIERLKLKGSWGQLGNQSLPISNPTVNTTYLSPNLAYYAYDGNGSSIATGALLTAIGNPDLRWETSQTTNLGFEIGMLQNKLSLSGEYFIINTNDFIVQDIQLNPSTGIDASAPFVNLGDAKNKGFDLGLSYADELSSGFSYGVSLNLSHYKNEVTKLLNNAPRSGILNLRNGNVTRTEVGEEMSYFYGRVVTGLDDKGRMVFADVNGDGTVNDSDRTKIGSPHPDFTYGININLAYKGFDAQLFFNGSQGNEIYNYNKVFTDFGLFFNGNRSTRVLDAWTPTNTNTNVPALSSSYPSEEASPNSYFVEDGSYLRFKNLQVGYTLPKSVTGKIGSESIRLYVQGTNIFTLTKYSGFDPEVISSGNLDLGVDSRLYPISKIFSIGANIKF